MKTRILGSTFALTMVVVVTEALAAGSKWM